MDKEKRKQYIFVIRELTSREIKRRYSHSKLGILWSVLNPLLHMAVMSMIFSQIFQRSIENFPIYYLTGNLIWGLFTGVTNSSITALVDNKNMLIKVKLPMQIFVLARTYTAFVNFLYSIIAYVAMICVFRVWPNWTIIFSPVIIILLMLFSMGIAFILSTIYVFFGDVKYLYSVLLTLWMYMSAIFYPVDRLSGMVQKVVKINPMFQFIDSMRSMVLHQSLPTVKQVAYLAVWSIVLYATGWIVFNKNKNKIMQKI